MLEVGPIVLASRLKLPNLTIDIPPGTGTTTETGSTDGIG